MAPDNRYLLEELGWITCVAWKKQQEEEKKRYRRQKLNVPKPNQA